MTTATANSIPVVRGRVRMPRCGLWVADLALDGQSELSGDVTIAVGDLELKGTAKRSGVALETSTVRVVAGAGGLSSMVPAKFYRQIPGKTIAKDILGAGGEALSDDSDQAVLGRQLQAYCQIAQPAGAALGSLCDYLGCIWRAKPDGTIWIGTESWPDAEAPGESMAQDPVERSETWGVEAPQLLPGTTVDGRKVSTVEHQVFADGLRTVVWYEADGAADDSEDRQMRAARAVIEHVTAPLDFFAIYRAKVASQNGDGTLELQLDDKRLPGLTKVPIRLGLPGVTVKVAAGARVDVEFEDGLATQPVASLWEPGSLTEIVVTATTTVTVDAGSAGTVNVKGGTVNVEGATAVNLGGALALLGVARQTDTVQAGPFPGTITMGSIKVKSA